MGIWIGSRTRPRVPTGPCGSAYLAGQSASFSGTNYLERATEAGISPASLPLILAGWVYLPTSSGFQTLVTKGEMSSGNYEWLIYFTTPPPPRGRGRGRKERGAGGGRSG